MKIFPSPHEVKVLKKPGFLDIPLSHIEQEIHPSKIVVETQPEYAFSSSKQISPYDTFQNDDQLIFDGNHNLVENVLDRKNGRYVYTPKDFKEFTPEDVGIAALIKRRCMYRSSENYNLRVGVYKSGEYKNFIKKLMPIFGDAPYRNVAPANVQINGGSKQVDDFEASNGTNLDFLFIESSNGAYTYKSNQKIDFNALMSTHCNLWLSIPDAKNTDLFLELRHEEYYNASIKGTGCVPYLGDTMFTDVNYGAMVDHNIEFSVLPRGINKYVHETLMPSGSPVYIIERPNVGYVVISDSNLFENLDKFSHYIYDVMMYVFLNSYQESASKTLWITDDKVDYMGSTTRPFRRTHENVCIDDLIETSGISVTNYDVIGIESDKQDVALDHIDKDKNVYFTKLTRTDPQKEVGMVSLYSINHTIFQYRQQPLYMLEEIPHISTEINDSEECYVTVEPFISSKHNIILTARKRFRLKYPDKEYYLVALPINANNESEVDLVEAKRYEGADNLILAKIHTEYAGTTISYDVRMLGGGLPSEYTDYEMLDIGGLKGRPFRIGVGAVIRLPKAYEKYDEQIRDAVGAYKVAADRIYLVYE